MLLLNRVAFSFAAVVIGLGTSSTIAQNPPAPPPAQEGQTTLPYAEPQFRGDICTTFKDSTPAKFPQGVKAPAGAPNVLLVLLDDAGFGQFSVSGGGVPSPNMEKLAATPPVGRATGRACLFDHLGGAHQNR